MLLRSKRSMGVLPEILVGMTLIFLIFGLLIIAFWTNRRAPIILVPDAIGTGAIAPAAVDDTYIRAFVVNFYSYWGTWNDNTYVWRRSQAIDMMTPSARPPFRMMAKQTGELAASMSQSQSISITGFAIEHLSATVTRVTVDGTIKVFYGGVGGDKPDPYHGVITLQEVPPAPENPFCLEVIGLTTKRESTL